LGDAKLSNATNVASVGGVIAPQVGTDGLEGGEVSGFDSFAGISGIGGDSSGALGGVKGRNNHVLTPGESLALSQVVPGVVGPASIVDLGVTTAARIRLLPDVSVPVLLVADLGTDPPTPAVCTSLLKARHSQGEIKIFFLQESEKAVRTHEGVVSVQSGIGASQYGGQTGNTSGSLLVTHRFRERRVLEVVLVFLSNNIVAGGGGAGSGGQGILEVQEASSLGDGDPTNSSGLNDKVRLGDGVGRAVFGNESRAGGQAGPATPGLVINSEDVAGVSGDTEAMVQ